MPLNWLDQSLADAREDEGFREYAYPDVLSKLFKATRNSVRWGFVPARNVQLPPGVSLGRWGMGTLTEFSRILGSRRRCPSTS